MTAPHSAPAHARRAARLRAAWPAAAALLALPLAAWLWSQRPPGPAGAPGARGAAAATPQRAGRSRLGDITVPFYMYEDDVMTLAEARKCPGFGTGHRMTGTDLAFFEVMRDHPWRVRDASRARVFVIATPLISSAWYRDTHGDGGCGGAHDARVTAAFRALFAHPLYKRHNASHYLHCHAWMCFLGPAWSYQKVFPRALYKEGNLSNIMMGRFERYFTTAADCAQYGGTFGICIPDADARRRYPLTGLYRVRVELARCVIPVPYHAEAGLRRLSPSFEEWSKRKHTVFYSAKAGAFDWNATALRHAPIKSDFRKLPGVRVAFKMPKEEWLAGFENSKFCLVARGDSPSSHALYNAIKAGCVPVIVSDAFSLVGQPFATQLPWSLFTVTLPEQAFVTDPVALGRFIWQLPVSHMRSLVENLQALAQPALLYEPGGALGEHLLRQLAAECLEA